MLWEPTTGWDDIHLPEYAHNDPTPATLKEGLDYHPHSRKSRWMPGTRMSYCNAGPPVAAYIVQKVTGQDFEDFVEQNFFAPLQMSGATYRLSESMQQRGATLYDNGVAEDYWHILMRPSGSINASARNMAKFLELFLGRGTVDGVQYVTPESIENSVLLQRTCPEASSWVPCSLVMPAGFVNTVEASWARALYPAEARPISAVPTS